MTKLEMLVTDAETIAAAVRVGVRDGGTASLVATAGTVGVDATEVDAGRVAVDAGEEVGSAVAVGGSESMGTTLGVGTLDAMAATWPGEGRNTR